VLKDIKPRAFLLENVEGLKFGGKDEGLKLFLSAIEHINAEAKTTYRPVVITLNAADYGVPQTRTRVFIIGARDGKVFKAPPATHRDPLDSASNPSLEPWMTAWDAIGQLEEQDDPDLRVTGKWGDLLPSIPEGMNYLWHTDRMGGENLFGWRRRYWNFLLKLAKDRPAWTIQAQPGPATGPFHWRSRRLSGEELARLQTFPVKVKICGGRGDVQRQIGNAVPSLLAEVLAREIRHQLLGRRLRTPLRLLPRRAAFVPQPERLMPVPAKYMILKGDHAAHPGTGRGYLYENNALAELA
jgi:DNA (cytosine-5)-methyltransferase 1